MFVADNQVRWHLLELVDHNDYIHVSNGDLNLPIVLCTIAAFVFIFIYLYLVKTYRHIISRPLFVLLIFYTFVLAIASYAPIGQGLTFYLWVFSLVLGHYLWFFAYTLLDAHSKKTSPLYLQLGHYTPFWGSTTVPFPKGSAYLRKIEAKNDEQYSKTQLKAIKLMTWVLILVIVNKFFDSLVYGSNTAVTRLLTDITSVKLSLNLPQFLEVQNAFMGGQAYHPKQSLPSLFASYLEMILSMTIMGGLIISGVRMAGYNALRNTYNPLFSTSIADFWNRFFYYFKELLVDFFFYPTFLRYFKNKPRLRLFFATMAAACFGNFLFHFFFRINLIMQYGILEAFLEFHVYLFYSFILGLAIGISQIRNETRSNRDASNFQRAKSFIIITVFFCFTKTIHSPDMTWNLIIHFQFIASLLIA